MEKDLTTGNITIQLVKNQRIKIQNNVTKS